MGLVITILASVLALLFVLNLIGLIGALCSRNAPKQPNEGKWGK